MSRYSLLVILSVLAVAGCNRAAVPETGLRPDQKPALAAPPSSMMTPNGY